MTQILLTGDARPALNAAERPPMESRRIRFPPRRARTTRSPCPSPFAASDPLSRLKSTRDEIIIIIITSPSPSPSPSSPPPTDSPSIRSPSQTVMAAFGTGGYVLVCTYFVLGSAVTKLKLEQKQREGIAEARSVAAASAPCGGARAESSAPSARSRGPRGGPVAPRLRRQFLQQAQRHDGERGW